MRARVTGSQLLRFEQSLGDSLSRLASPVYLNVFTFIPLVFGVSSEFSDTPNIGTDRVSTVKQLTMPPQERSKKNIPDETDQEEHHHLEGNEISFVPEPSNITDQE
jgi:hypothetical protein